MDNSEAIDKRDRAEQSSAVLRVQLLQQRIAALVMIDVLRQRERDMGRGRSWQRGVASDDDANAE